MAHRSERLNYLFQRFLRDQASAEEVQELWDMIAVLKDSDFLNDTMGELWHSAKTGNSDNQKDWSKAEDRLHQFIAGSQNAKRPRAILFSKRKWSVAASILILLAAGTFWIVNSRNSQRSLAGNRTEVKSNPGVPGSDRAMLTLMDGSTISLDSISSGSIARQGMLTLVKEQDGRLTYEQSLSVQSSKSISTTPEEYNTLSIPRGGQYRLMLSDGTQVWLNSESKLRFPVHFGNKTRPVYLSGEGYFEVAANSKPFIVNTDKVNVNVLGTKFNVSAYSDDQAIITTLAEGKVSVQNIKDSEGILLHPGQQVLYARPSESIKMVDVDANLYTAWKDGKFYFKKEKLGVLMKKLARWYDVQVEFQDPAIANKLFTGVALRSKNIQYMLDMINRTTEIKYKLEDRKLTILQK
jgi:transmembrane sensor